MKKVSSFIFALAALFIMNLSFSVTAEAARVAVVPLQVNEKQVERAKDFTNYYWDVIIEKLKYPDYDLVSDEIVGNAVPDEGLKSFDQATLKDVLEKTDAELVIAMRIDKVEERPYNFQREPKLNCMMKAEYAAYNRLTGKYYAKKINYSRLIEEVLTFKTDWQQEVFASELKRSINRSIEEKKKN
jgi:hypothetical protein